jgi:hypothetical protein
MLVFLKFTFITRNYLQKITGKQNTKILELNLQLKITKFEIRTGWDHVNKTDFIEIKGHRNNV